MPSAWIIGPFVIKSSIIIVVGSFIVGFIFFRLSSPFSKLETKQRSDEMISLLIVFVISLWIGKILVNFSTFLSDPRAILAYPSDSRAFYIAVLFTMVYGEFKMVDHYQKLLDLLFSFMYIFLSASFVYEFVQITWGGGEDVWGYLGLLVTLLIILILLQSKATIAKLTFVSILGWSLGQWVLSTFYQTSVFHYYLDQWFYSVIFISSLFLILYRKRVK
ncbi:hypothetical protein MUO14_07245 [Halobacillus shinanisalinarum]|uniref:Uncharacterized protein n=1 Tax=Halobacillus shinanisalinarum TaxID=2932258 RepID=A0ABY4H495_9BACI|nr:hypothetical protein [Halobacillus shinanisalinarum]UOQ94730.1 hypothetical protein MUO14_07245 [Halobacillus shinanisalinarum]